MILETRRLILRPWQEVDAERLYEYAKDPRVGPAAGWPVHESVDHSRQIIRDILSTNETYAVTLRGDARAIGSIGLMIGDKSNLGIAAQEGEIGYWIGVPYWGRGLITEAVRELMRYAFEELELTTLWIGYFDGNEPSRRVQEKCGFRFHRTEPGKPWPRIDAVKAEHIACITKQEWTSRP